MKKETKKGKSWRLGYQTGRDELLKELASELEKMKKPERKEARTTREKLYLGYNKCLSDLKQKFGV